VYSQGTKQMITRAQYLSNTRAHFEEYYLQFSNDMIKRIVRDRIFKLNSSYDDIPLNVWGSFHGIVSQCRKNLKEVGHPSWSLSDTVCLLKIEYKILRRLEWHTNRRDYLERYVNNFVLAKIKNEDLTYEFWLDNVTDTHAIMKSNPHTNLLIRHIPIKHIEEIRYKVDK
jgi:hypothetical protein